MSSVVIGQPLRVTSTLNINLTGATNVQINYTSPSGVTGYVLAVVDTLAIGVIHADFPSTLLVVLGDWVLWASAITSSGDVVKTYGIVVKVVPEATLSEMYLTLNPTDFLYTRNFTGFADNGVSEIQEGIAQIQAQFSGVLNYYWGGLESSIQLSKRNYVFNLLVAWYMADKFPSNLVGVTGNAGLPMVKKSIGGVDITFEQYKVQEDMKVLTTNTFGMRALMMLLTAPERFGMLGSSTTVFPQNYNSLSVLNV